MLVWSLFLILMHDGQSIIKIKKIGLKNTIDTWEKVQ